MEKQSGLQKTIDALAAFDFEGEVKRIIEANKKVLADLLKEQLAAGKDAYNKPVTLNGSKQYKPFTIQYKKKHGSGLGAVTNRITLYMSGELYSKLFTSIHSNVFSIKSSVPYFDDLVLKTGDQVTGLNEESRKKFVFKILLPAFKKVFHTKTGIKL